MVLMGTNLFEVDVDFAVALFFLLLPAPFLEAVTDFFFGDCFLGARVTGKMSPLVFDRLITLNRSRHFAGQAYYKLSTGSREPKSPSSGLRESLMNDFAHAINFDQESIMPKR